MPDPNQTDPALKKEDHEAFLKKGNLSKGFNPYTMPQAFYQEGNRTDTKNVIKSLEDRVESLENLIKSIFDGHVLINGRFVRITP